MKCAYFIKFETHNVPELWVRDNFEEFWNDLREFMFRNNTGKIEWMILK